MQPSFEITAPTRPAFDTLNYGPCLLYNPTLFQLNISMPKRVIHKVAIRDIDRWDKSKGTHEVQLCIEYIPYYVAKKPILTRDWGEVTCKYCHNGRFNGVPDGIGERKFTLLQGGLTEDTTL